MKCCFCPLTGKFWTDVGAHFEVKNIGMALGNGSALVRAKGVPPLWVALDKPFISPKQPLKSFAVVFEGAAKAYALDQLVVFLVKAA